MGLLGMLGDLDQHGQDITARLPARSRRANGNSNSDGTLAMKLTDLNPRWVGAGGPGITDADGNPVPKREGVGMTFDCPCRCNIRACVIFKNPLDGGDPIKSESPLWTRSGRTFDNITLIPSIMKHPVNGCRGWHGFIRDGNVTSA